MSYHLNALDELIEQFRKLPNIGSKLAQRLSLHVLDMTDEQAQEFSNCILNAKRTIHYCSCCMNITDQDVCSICSDPKRDRSVICVVECPTDVIAIEKTMEYRGLYHVLHGLISPSDNIGPNDIHIRELLKRLEADEVKEIIIATNPTVEGDATAMYLSKLIKSIGVNVTRLAFGLPVGGELEYADELTLTRALENRREIH